MNTMDAFMTPMGATVKLSEPQQHLLVALQRSPSPKQIQVSGVKPRTARSLERLLLVRVRAHYEKRRSRSYKSHFVHLKSEGEGLIALDTQQKDNVK